MIGLRKGLLTTQTEEFYNRLFRNIENDSTILPKKTILFRGVKLDNESSGHVYNVSNTLGDNGFMSKTLSFDVAKDFTSRKRYILFFPDTDNILYAKLQGKTFFNENEVLTFPGEKYRITDTYYVIHKNIAYHLLVCSFIGSVLPSYIIDDETSTIIDRDYDFIIEQISKGHNLIIGDPEKIYCKIINKYVKYFYDSYHEKDIDEFELKLLINLCLYYDIRGENCSVRIEEILDL